MRCLSLPSFVILMISLVFFPYAERVDAGELFGLRYCDQKGFYCLKIEKTKKRYIKTQDGSTQKLGRYSLKNLSTQETTYTDKRPAWKTLWPDEREEEIVRKLNRLNVRIRVGMTLAVPSNMTGKTFMDYSPFPFQREALGEKVIIWDPSELAWGAYDEKGRLMRWGPGVGGKNYCPDIRRSCRTVVGDDFKILYKKGANARSDRYPVGRGGAPMPYYMPFYGPNYGFHGSPNVPGMHDSHGCVRLFTADAKWLNMDFAEKGTRVIIKPYPEQKIGKKE